MAFKKLDDIKIENAKIIFKNFAGKPSQYNRAGSRTFCVVIDDDIAAEHLSEDGWNIRILPPREEDGEPLRYLPVQVSFGNYPPKVIIHSGNVATILNEDTIESLDYAEIKSVDLIIRPYNWEIKDKAGVKTGVKAYLKTMHVVLDEDPFAMKYASEESPRETEDVPW